MAVNRTISTRGTLRNGQSLHLAAKALEDTIRNFPSRRPGMATARFNFPAG